MVPWGTRLSEDSPRTQVIRLEDQRPGTRTNVAPALKIYFETDGQLAAADCAVATHRATATGICAPRAARHPLHCSGAALFTLSQMGQQIHPLKAKRGKTNGVVSAATQSKGTLFRVAVGLQISRMGQLFYHLETVCVKYKTGQRMFLMPNPNGAWWQTSPGYYDLQTKSNGREIVMFKRKPVRPVSAS